MGARAVEGRGLDIGGVGGAIGRIGRSCICGWGEDSVSGIKNDEITTWVSCYASLLFFFICLVVHPLTMTVMDHRTHSRYVIASIPLTYVLRAMTSLV